MNYALKAFAFFVVLATVSFQTIPVANAQAGTYMYCNGVWRFGNCGGASAPFAIPPGIGGQQFAQGQRIQCSMMDRAVTAGVDALGMGLAGLAVAKIFHGNVNNSVVGGAAAGAAYGLTLGCNPYMVNDGNETVVIVPGQRQALANDYRRRQSGDIVRRGGTISEPSECKVYGMNTVWGLTPEECTARRMSRNVSSPAVVRQQPQQQIAATEKNPCADQVDRIPVIRANGDTACRKIGSPAEPGEKPYP